MNATSLIYKLTETSEFKKLQQIGLEIHDNQRKFDLLTVYKELIDEMAWSRLFAYLLDSSQNHGLGQSAFRKLLEVIPELKSFSQLLPIDNHSQTLCIIEWKTENSRRIDILIKLIDNKGYVKAVVGIENKVDSGEQIDQVRDYQKSLIKAFPEIPKTIIYLTPDGRLTETADDILNCPAISVSFKSISEVCEQIQVNALGQGKIFLSVLKNHIDKITNTQIMDKEALELIKKLYKDSAYRQAIKLISQYSPNVRSVFDELSSKLSKSNKFPFKLDNTSIDYYPKTSSNPHEFKIYIDELSDITFDKGFSPSYMLCCENTNPDFGDVFTLRIALWYSNSKGKDSASRNNLRNNVSSNFIFPNSLGADKHWSQWICLWTGGSYKLTDMGEKDVEELNDILINGITETYDQYIIGLKKLAKAKL